MEAGNDGFSHPLGEEEFEDIREHNLSSLCSLAAAVAAETEEDNERNEE